MKYFSLNNKSENVGFRDATLYGQAPDKGLYFPETLPTFNTQLIKNIAGYSNAAIAYEIIKPYVGVEIDDNSLKNIVEETVNFEFPLKKITENIFALELYHGPTLAFKDVGARFMSRCLGYFSKSINKKIVVLVATSGDTGGAVASGFYMAENVEVVILYPSGKVSDVQEKQLTALGQNIHALEVEGSFDDCQSMVKNAFANTETYKNIFLTSANSINIARWLPQQFYYLFAYKQWQRKDITPVVCVPSGNFGNIAAGLLAFASGLPVSHFIAACNANDTVPKFLQSHIYNPGSTVHTISNAMDVSNPSNFVRVLQIIREKQASISDMLSAISVDDTTTISTMQYVHQKQNYIVDPHGAVAFYALKQYLDAHPDKQGIFLETAHPVKFNDTVKEAIGIEIPFPDNIAELMKEEKRVQKIEANYGALKAFLEKI